MAEMLLPGVEYLVLQMLQPLQHEVTSHVLFRREDLQNLPKGRVLLQSIEVQDHELLARPGLWHSRAQVIEGKFELLPCESEYYQRECKQATSDQKEELFWCNKRWDPKTGGLLTCDSKPQHVRKSCSLSNRFVLA